MERRKLVGLHNAMIKHTHKKNGINGDVDEAFGKERASSLTKLTD